MGYLDTKHIKFLQDLYPAGRIYAGKLPDCIKDGVTKLKDIVSDTMYFQDDVTVYLFQEKFEVPLDEDFLCNCLTKWDMYPGRREPVDKSLLVNIKNVTLDDFKDELKSFHVCQPIVAVIMQRMFSERIVDLTLPFLTKEQKENVIMYSLHSDESLLYPDLHDGEAFFPGVGFAGPIQYALERKVVSVLVTIAQYIQPLVPHHPEELKKTLYESLYNNIHDSLKTQTVITEFFPRPEGMYEVFCVHNLTT
ncbi:hypothetical protein ACF0H5_005973 [Mactra antiquata]